MSAFYGDVIYATYQELVEKLGEPTRLVPSDDGKVQKTWELTTDTSVKFSIYDWKEYDRYVTDGRMVIWNIGRDSGQNDIIEYLNGKGVKVKKGTWML